MSLRCICVFFFGLTHLRGICVIGVYVFQDVFSGHMCFWGIFIFDVTHFRGICVFGVYMYLRCVYVFWLSYASSVYMCLPSICIFEVFFGSFVSLGHVNPGIQVFGEYTSSRCKGLLGICKIDVYVSSLHLCIRVICIFGVYTFSEYMRLRCVFFYRVYTSSGYIYFWGICVFEVYVLSG